MGVPLCWCGGLPIAMGGMGEAPLANPPRHLVRVLAKVSAGSVDRPAQASAVRRRPAGRLGLAAGLAADPASAVRRRLGRLVRLGRLDFADLASVRWGS